MKHPAIAANDRASPSSTLRAMTCSMFGPGVADTKKTVTA
jgi:hypothetical protein